jgi:hypothetical protein
MIVQQLEKGCKDNIQVAERYYNILSAINNLCLTDREIQLVAFTAVRGSITYTSVREEFCTKYGSSFPTINNIVAKLKKSKIFVKSGKYIVVNPMIALDFSKPLMLQITLTINENGSKREALKYASEGMVNKEGKPEVVSS